ENQKQALSLLEGAHADVEELQRQHPGDRAVERWALIVRHDLARHRLYFHQHAEEAKREFQDVIAKCGDEPDRQQLKIAALRNVADVCHRYAYGLPTDPDGAIEHLQNAKRLATATPEARSRLPDIAYELAKALARGNRADQSTGELGRALRLARRDGNALILALADNRRFWTEHNQTATLDSAVWPEWR